VYHNLTAHYNAYYNGEVSLDEAIVEIKTAHKDDYTQVLDVFQLATNEEVQASYPKLDRAILKASLVVHKHSMFFGKKENVKWVYYSYLMIGQSRFYKHEYGIAKQVFQYIVTKYPKETVKYDAKMWIALIESLDGDYDDALSNLDGIKNRVSQGLTSKEVYRMIPMVYADVYIKSKNYEAAIPYLKMAIDRNHKKAIRARLLFILGQVQQKRDKLKGASNFFAQVLKNNPSYEMDFNARIKMAECYTGGDSKEVYKQLNKMLKDVKNKDYQDQIYYALAQVSLKEKHVKEAMGYLKKSVQTSTTNNKQKAFSALQLAGLYFDKKEYTYAQAYYDSTMMFLPKDYPDYDKLNERKIVLTELVTNLLIVQTEDSLQRMAALSQYDRNKLIDNVIEELVFQEKKAKEAERLRQENMQFMESNRQGPKSVTNTGKAKWYFYNTASLSSGRTEFLTKWGNRKLEDNWRRGDKQSGMGDMTMNEEEEGDTEEGSDGESGESGETSSKKSTNNKHSRDYYLSNVPLTATMMDSSNFRIQQALFNMGIIYKEKLRNLDEAANAFEKLIDRYPKGDFTPETYYHLYQLYNLQGISSEANRYKKLLIKEYPESDYAKILQDPKYFEKLAKEANRAKDFYKETYAFYQSGNYKNVRLNNTLAKKYYQGENEILAKFEMLNALTVGKTGDDTAAFIEALRIVVNDYPKSEVKVLAENMIAQLQSGPSSFQSDGSSANEGGEAQQTQKTIFVYDADDTHLFMILADQRNLKIRELTKRISNHNKKYFGLEKLNVKTLPINENILLVSVGNFKDKAASLKYFKTIRRNTVLYGMIKRVGGNYFVISQGNYRRLYQSKDLTAYRTFFDQYYPEGK